MEDEELLKGEEEEEGSGWEEDESTAELREVAEVARAGDL